MTQAPAAAPLPTPLPTPLAERSLAPDLARGALLLFIAIANAPWYLFTSETRGLSAWPVDASIADRIVQSISLIAIDGRSYPMFAALFGYGMWQLYSRQLDAGGDKKAVRRLLLRRNAWMLLIGLFHAALLWAGDIVGAYGLVGLLIGWLFLGRRDRTLAIWIAVLTLGLIANLTAAALLPASAGAAAFDFRLGIDQVDYRASLDDRLLAWLILTPAQAVALIVPTAVLVAILAARHRLLENPAAHLPLLRRAAIVGIGLGWLGGGLAAAQNANLLGLDSSFDTTINAVQTITGLACGLGYVALFGVIAARISVQGRFVTALRSLGSRSLTFYLAQSLAFAPVMSAWGLGLGEQLSSWSIALYAVVVWAVTLGLAAVLGRFGIRGPAETLLRSLSYRAKRSTTAP